MKSSAELRKAFLEYFAERGHEVVPSSALVPQNDPTLLFTNAGMVQFKDVFLGREKRPYTRATSSQRCVRAGGKHNDLENVGYTARHHTFFEMLGNFSFGDYFKREAIAYAWEFLTEMLGLPPERLWVTVYEEDDEAAEVWLNEIGVDPARFARIGAHDNFWSMGDTGPCGPCTEIFYDHGPGVSGGPPGSPDADGDRYVEIWNLVFMQYDRDRDGILHPLPKPSVDTGMGLERLAAVVQGVHSNYDIELFQNLMRVVADMAGISDLDNSSLRVIADHIRSCSFLIADGVLPSNEGRGYVLRRIIRRAARHGHKLGLTEPFFYRLVEPLAVEMGDAYPELRKHQTQIEEVLHREEERFAETLEHGLRILEEDIATLSGDTLSGETVFKLYDTYGFPVDLTADIARERDLQIDMEGFEREMEGQRARARAASQFEADYGERIEIDRSSHFSGYEHVRDHGQVMALIREGQLVAALEEGQTGRVVLDSTPFYAESGGQVGDTGWLEGPGGRFRVTDTQKEGKAIAHLGVVEQGRLAEGESIVAQVDAERRRAIVLNHSATHLMHAALRSVLGDHVQQKGSLVDENRTRFDFSHFQPVTHEQLQRIEQMVNEQIRDNAAAQARVMPLKKALDAGAMALFGEKYGEEVRVLSIGDFSVELCGGTHVERAGDIGIFKIVSESGVAAGIRRIEAVTGPKALERFEQDEQQLAAIASTLNARREEVIDKVQQLNERMRTLEKELEQLKTKLASQAGGDLASQAVEIDGMKVLAARLDGADSKTLRDTLDQLKNKLGAAAVVLGSVEDGKVRLVAGVTKAEAARLKAGELINAVAEQVGGRGGGRPDMAQAGGNQPENLDAALASVPEWVRAQLG
jgi:alanyl-tRNA synthetase